MALKHFAQIVGCYTALMAVGSTFSIRAANDSFYNQNNLVSDLNGGMQKILVNAWGLDASPNGPWWVNANGTGLSIVYDSNGAPFPTNQPLVVTIPSANGTDTGTPTGIVYNVFNTTGDFTVGSGQAAVFIFATEDGTISGWNPAAAATTAIVKVRTTNGVYKGLAIGQISGTTNKLIYAANFRSGAVDVFDTNFAPANPAILATNAFRDLTLPAGYAPFNVQNINGSLYVTFALQDSEKHDDVAGAGNGYVDQFTLDGTLVKRLQHGNWLNSPWGVALAPFNFGEMSGRLLVGNFGSGQIASFDPQSGNFQGMMLSHGNHPVTIDGLWGIKFGNGFTAGPMNVLFFAAGIDGESHGLFGTLTAKHGGD